MNSCFSQHNQMPAVEARSLILQYCSVKRIKTIDVTINGYPYDLVNIESRALISLLSQMPTPFHLKIQLDSLAMCFSRRDQDSQINYSSNAYSLIEHQIGYKIAQALNQGIKPLVQFDAFSAAHDYYLSFAYGLPKLLAKLEKICAQKFGRKSRLLAWHQQLQHQPARLRNFRWVWKMIKRMSYQEVLFLQDPQGLNPLIHSRLCKLISFVQFTASQFVDKDEQIDRTWYHTEHYPYHREIREIKTLPNTLDGMIKQGMHYIQIEKQGLEWATKHHLAQPDVANIAKVSELQLILLDYVFQSGDWLRMNRKQERLQRAQQALLRSGSLDDSAVNSCLFDSQYDFED